VTDELLLLTPTLSAGESRFTRTEDAYAGVQDILIQARLVLIYKSERRSVKDAVASLFGSAVNEDEESMRGITGGCYTLDQELH
jgi:hypothetical protein